MRSSLGAATLAALEAEAAAPIYFLELLLDVTSSPQVTVRLHTGLGTITWGGYDWTGAGSLLSVEGVEETSEINPAPFRCALSGVNSQVTDLVFTQNFHLRPCNFYLGALSDGALIEDPGVIHAGFVQDLQMQLGGKDTVVLTSESEMIFFQRTRNVRYTDRQLQSEYPGDLGLEYVDEVAGATVKWRGQNNQLGGGGGGPGPGLNPRSRDTSSRR